MALFEGIGRIGDYAQMKNLRREMKYRIKTGQSLAQAMGTPVQPSRVRADEAQKTNKNSDANREMQIRQKLRQGQKLSATDKQYLKENNPDLYEKVERIEERREVLARALKCAKTKDEALRAVAQANIAVLAEMKSGSGDAPSVHGIGGGSAEGSAPSPVMTAGGADAAGDALDAPLTEGGAAAPTSGEMQGALGREALGAEGAGAQTAEPTAAADAHGTEAEKKGFQSEPSTRDQYGNRRVLSHAEMEDMLRQAQESGKLTPLDNEKVYLLRALQREWMEYANSEDYQSLPNTALDAAEEEERGVRRKRRADTDIISVRPAPSPAEILAAHRYYHAAYGGEAFEAKG